MDFKEKEMNLELKEQDSEHNKKKKEEGSPKRKKGCFKRVLSVLVLVVIIGFSFFAGRQSVMTSNAYGTGLNNGKILRHPAASDAIHHPVPVSEYGEFAESVRPEHLPDERKSIPAVGGCHDERIPDGVLLEPDGIRQCQGAASGAGDCRGQHDSGGDYIQEGGRAVMKTKKLVVKYLTVAGLLICLAVVLVPFYIIVSNSFKPYSEIAKHISALPAVETMENVFDFPIFANAKAAFSSGIATERTYDIKGISFRQPLNSQQICYI